MHLVMEHLDFAKALEHGGISYPGNGREAAEHGSSFRTGSKSDQDRFKSRDFLRLRPDGVLRRRALCRRQREFILQKDVSGTQAIVQGIIDCFFEEEDGMVIIDYKNSYVGSEAGEEELRQRYGEQLRHYIRKR